MKNWMIEEGKESKTWALTIYSPAAPVVWLQETCPSHSHHRKPIYIAGGWQGEQELRALWVMYYVSVSSLLTVELLIGPGSIRSIAREDQLTVHWVVP